MFKYLAGCFLALFMLALPAEANHDGPTKPGEIVNANFICMDINLLMTLAKLHVEKGMQAAQEEIKGNQEIYQAKCGPGMGQLEEIVAELKGFHGHVVIWKIDVGAPFDTWTVEIKQDAGA